MDLTDLVAGFGLGLSLIVAIGAQNAFVLRQGVRREHVFAVAAVCAVSDLVLIVLGVSGIGAVLEAVPWLIDVVRWVGAAFLVCYGLLAARRALRPSGESLAAAAGAGTDADAGASAPWPVQEELGSTRRVGHDTPGASRGVPEARSERGGTVPTPVAPGVATAARVALVPTLLTCLALTWLNPHVYLDTVFLLGSVANTHGDGRWAFAVGAGMASLAWFFGLAYGARGLGRWLATPRAWRILDGVIAVVMVGLGISLVLPH